MTEYPPLELLDKHPDPRLNKRTKERIGTASETTSACAGLESQLTSLAASAGIDLATARVVSSPWWRRAWARIWGAGPDRIALLLHEQEILLGIVKRQNALLVELHDENQGLYDKIAQYNLSDHDDFRRRWKRPAPTPGPGERQSR